MSRRDYTPRWSTAQTTLHLAELSQVALWKMELSGQLSDGAWENSRRNLSFWWKAEVQLASDRVGVETDHQWEYGMVPHGFAWAKALCSRDCDLSYRMIYYVKTALYFNSVEQAHSIDLEGIGDWNRIKTSAATCDKYWVERLAKLAGLGITDEVVQAIEAVPYTRSDLLKDLSLISQQMKVLIGSNTSPASFKRGYRKPRVAKAPKQQPRPPMAATLVKGDPNELELLRKEVESLRAMVSELRAVINK